MRLAGKNALITGGTSGIGLATAKLFQQEGARVAVTGRDPAALEQARAELGETALVLRADVRSIEDMKRVSQQIKDTFGGLDVLFANAGLVYVTPLESISSQQYNDIMDTHIKGVVFSMQAALSIFRDGASVILNTSFAALTGDHGISLVAAAKAALRSLARSWSYELLSRRIRVNAVAPGGIETPLLGKLGMTAEQVATFKQEFSAKVPVGRMGRPEEIAAAVLYLASDESQYVVGFELVVDGGASQL